MSADFLKHHPSNATYQNICTIHLAIINVLMHVVIDTISVSSVWNDTALSWKCVCLKLVPLVFKFLRWISICVLIQVVKCLC